MLRLVSLIVSLVTLAFIPVPSAFAVEVTNIPQVGKHHRPLIVEKSINRQNILSAYTKTDENCRLLTDRSNRNTPVLDFYWLNNRTAYEPLDRSLGSMIRERLKVEASNDRDSVLVRLTDLGSMRHDLPDPRVLIKAEQEGFSRECQVEATIQMGPADRNSVLKVESIFLEMGMMGGVNAITISGKTKFTGRAIKKRYVANTGW
jgi:hypothetical protein